MKPVISQLSVDPPNSLKQHPDVPSVNEVDDILVSCVGQMAVTSASDVLWKPLNHEVSLDLFAFSFIRTSLGFMLRLCAKKWSCMDALFVKKWRTV